jgi:DNA replication protein DnaC
MTLKELLAIVNERYPQERRAVLDMIHRGFAGTDDAREAERRENIRRAMRVWDVGYGWDLPHGVVGAKTLDEYSPDPQHPATGQAKEAVLLWVEGPGRPLLTLAGPPGVGKSHLADGAAMRLLEREAEVVYRSESDLLGDLQGAMRSHTLEDRLRAYGAVPWLIVDDLGLAATGDWMRGLLDQLVDVRWQGARGRLRTLITSNLKSQDLPPRIASRLADVDLGQVIQVAAPDYRRRGRGGGGS